jgi:hypothetical protein
MGKYDGKPLRNRTKEGAMVTIGKQERSDLHRTFLTIDETWLRKVRRVSPF